MNQEIVSEQEESVEIEQTQRIMPRTGEKATVWAGVNMRSYASLSAPATGYISPGDRIMPNWAVTIGDDGQSWQDVTNYANGRYGYIRSSYIRWN